MKGWLFRERDGGGLATVVQAISGCWFVSGFSLFDWCSVLGPLLGDLHERPQEENSMFSPRRMYILLTVPIGHNILRSDNRKRIEIIFPRSPSKAEKFNSFSGCYSAAWFKSIETEWKWLIFGKLCLLKIVQERGDSHLKLQQPWCYEPEGPVAERWGQTR